MTDSSPRFAPSASPAPLGDAGSRADATTKDATTKDATTKDATTKDATTKDATTKDATNNDATNKDALFPDRGLSPPAGRFYAHAELARMWKQGAREGSVGEVRRAQPFFARPAFPREEVCVWTANAQGQKRVQSRPVAARDDWIGFWRFESHTHAWIISGKQFTLAAPASDSEADAFHGSARWAFFPLPPEELLADAHFDREAIAAHLEDSAHLAPKTSIPAGEKPRPLSLLSPRFQMPEVSRMGFMTRQPLFFIGPRGALSFASPGAVILCSPGVDQENALDWKFEAINPFELASGWRFADDLLRAESATLFGQDRMIRFRMPSVDLSAQTSRAPRAGLHGGPQEALAPDNAPFSFRSQNDYREDTEPDPEQVALLDAAGALEGPLGEQSENSRHFPGRGDTALDERAADAEGASLSSNFGFDRIAPRTAPNFSADANVGDDASDPLGANAPKSAASASSAPQEIPPVSWASSFSALKKQQKTVAQPTRRHIAFEGSPLPQAPMDANPARENLFESIASKASAAPQSNKPRQPQPQSRLLEPQVESSWSPIWAQPAQSHSPQRALPRQETQSPDNSWSPLWSRGQHAPAASAALAETPRQSPRHAQKSASADAQIQAQSQGQSDAPLQSVFARLRG